MENELEHDNSATRKTLGNGCCNNIGVNRTTGRKAIIGTMIFVSRFCLLGQATYMIFLMKINNYVQRQDKKLSVSPNKYMTTHCTTHIRMYVQSRTSSPLQRRDVRKPRSSSNHNVTMETEPQNLSHFLVLFILTFYFSLATIVSLVDSLM